MNTIEYLDAVKDKLKIESDAGLANVLRTSRQYVSKYRLGQVTMNNITAVRVAELLEINPMLVIADVEGETAKSEEERKTWENFSRRLRGIAAAIVLIILGVPGVPQTAKAGSLYIMLRDKRRKQGGEAVDLAV